MRRLQPLVLALVALSLLGVACSESAPDGASPATTPPASSAPGTATSRPAGTSVTATSGPAVTAVTEPPEPDKSDSPDDSAAGRSIVERHAGAEWFMGTIPDVPVAADASMDPIKIGMINQENTPLGSFPELRFAADAAINWINAELGGVDGRPLELVWCISAFSAEESQACAQELVQQDVVALVGGINVMAQSALPVLEQNGVAIVGGIPAGLAEQRSPLVFTFSGGSVGGMAAMLQHAVDNGAERGVIAYGDFDAFEASADYARRVGEHLGLEMKLVKFPIIASDFLPVLSQAVDFDADAVIVAAADTACVPVMQTFRDLAIDAQLYLVGACISEPILAAADGAHVGVVFSGEGPPSTDSLEGTIWDEVTDGYSKGPARGAGTVGFRGMMNLYSLLSELGGDGVNRASIIELIRRAKDRPSFWGHPYTCDGTQVPGLPALCAPQQALFTMAVFDEIDFVSDWIDTAALFAAAID